MINFIRKIVSIIFKIKLYLIENEIKGKVTYKGVKHGVSERARVYLHNGSTKDDIVMEDHSELFGVINTFNHGKVHIGEWTTLGRDSLILSVNSVKIGNNCAIAGNVIITDNNYHPINPSDRLYMSYTPHGSIERSPIYSANAPVKIGNNVWIGTYARISKGVTIGDNSIIGANSVVTKDIPANCIAVGNPARVVKENIDNITTPSFPLNKA